MRMSVLTNAIFFDTDCISSFLWVDSQSLLQKMYSGRIIIPRAVYAELSNPVVKHLKQRIDKLVADNIAEIMDIEIMTEEYDLYRSMTTYSNTNKKIIGKGEAASITLAKKHNGILGSNNLRDIQYYIDKYSLKHITTADIMLEAYERGFISVEKADKIWADMIRSKRKIGAGSFTEYLKLKRSDKNSIYI